MGTTYRAPRVTTVATAAGTLHAVDTARAATTDGPGHIRTVCGRVLAPGWLMMRSSPTADAYVTCRACGRRLADGVTVSASTVRYNRLRSTLSD